MVCMNLRAAASAYIHRPPLTYRQQVQRTLAWWMLALIFIGVTLGTVWVRQAVMPSDAAPAGRTPAVATLLAEQHQAQLRRAVAVTSAAHACHPVAWWQAPAVRRSATPYPATMLVQPAHTWTVVVRPWSFHTGGGYVRALCAR